MPIKVSQRPEYAVLAKLLEEVREHAGLSQSELARRLGRRQAFIWKIENAIQSPNLIELNDIAERTGADLVEIIRTWRERTSS
ncbi:MAG TPA: helix-turn-helix transcriptional regulator [Fimbriimonadaceae bacterium]|nr:helix-turn-helix transcriptional regulator [Fimbriimonadaceae bacterium]